MGESVSPRNVSSLKLPALGCIERDELGMWRMAGADGEPVTTVQWFLADLAASDAADSTLRSYAYDLLRWFRFLHAIDVAWERDQRGDLGPPPDPSTSPRQRPRNRGSRFSTNASAASRWSSVSPVCR